jgi:hypothetical protein
VDVVKDKLISVASNIEVVFLESHNLGQISDDYSLRKLQLIYYDENQIKAVLMEITKENIQAFFYLTVEFCKRGQLRTLFSST